MVLETHVHLASERGRQLATLCDAAADYLEKLYGGAAFRPVASDSAICLTCEGMIVGFVVLRNWEDENCCWIGQAWVMPTYRRRGLYAMLFRAAARRARHAGYSSMGVGVAARNGLSQRTHERLGFRPVMYSYQL